MPKEGTVSFNPDPGVAQCPHCGGKDGFQTTTTLKGTTLYGWDGVNEVGDLTVIRETNPRCQNCGKSVRELMR